MKNKYTKKEIEFLKKNYSNLSKEQIMERFPIRTWDAIKIKANKLNLSKKTTDRSCSKNISVLLTETPETYYWIGFLMADGSFDDVKMTMKFSLQEKDTDHVLLFKKYIKYIGNFKLNEFKVMNKDIVNKIIKKFDFKSNKTYNPPDKNIINKMNDNLFFSFLIGFIDGDGYIQKDKRKKNEFRITIKLHQSWIDILQLLSDRICNYLKLKNYSAIINNQGFAKIGFSNFEIVKFLKKHAINYNLPILKRKWDLIDIKYISRSEKSKKDYNNILDLQQKKYTKREIGNILNLPNNIINNCFRKNNLIK